MRVLREEVLRHFLRQEASRGQYVEKRDEILRWCDLGDAELIAQAKQFMQERPDTNPALLYLVGDRANRISHWNRESVECPAIYSCGIRPSVNPDLERVRGNLLDFANRYARKYADFSGPDVPQGEAAVLILVAQPTPGKKGTHELVDGVHRFVALCRSGASSVEAYVGYKEGR